MRINHDIIEAVNSASISKTKKKVMIATPTYDGRVCSQYSLDLVKTIYDLNKNGIDAEIIHCKHMTHAYARNVLVNAFLDSDCTHILFIDDDQGWDYTKIAKMVEMDQYFISAAIRYKEDNERYPLTLELDYDSRPKYGPYKLIKAFRIGVALALIKRECFDEVRKKNNIQYIRDVGFEFFEYHARNGQYQSEDYDFCEKVRNAFIPIWIYSDVDTKHFGTKEYAANFDIFLRKLPGGDLYQQEKKEVLSGLRVKPIS